MLAITKSPKESVYQSLNLAIVKEVDVQCSCFPVKVAPSAFLGRGVAATTTPFCAILFSRLSLLEYFSVSLYAMSGKCCSFINRDSTLIPLLTSRDGGDGLRSEACIRFFLAGYSTRNWQGGLMVELVV